MKKLMAVLVILFFLSSGCMTYSETVTSGWKTRTYDNEMYIARSRHRHRYVQPLEPGQPVAFIKEDPQAEIFDDRGYKDGLVCVFINDSRYELRIVIDDPHGHRFTLRVPPSRNEFELSSQTWTTIPGWLEFRLEMGLHRLRAFRDGWSTPYVQGEFRVRSDKTFHVEVGQMHYFGGARFGD